LLHPYFDEVASDVLALMKGGLKDLDKAYTKAVRMNDDVWQKSQAATVAAQKAATDAQRKADIDKAKRAGVTSETTTAVNGSAKPKSLQDHSRKPSTAGATNPTRVSFECPAPIVP
jgi:hypothetical protein